MGIDLVFQGLELGLGFGDIELFYPGFVVFFFQIEKEDFVDIGDEAGGDDDHEDGVDEMVGVGHGFVRREHPEAEEGGGQGTGIDDIGKEEGDDDGEEDNVEVIEEGDEDEEDEEEEDEEDDEDEEDEMVTTVPGGPDVVRVPPS